VPEARELTLCAVASRPKFWRKSISGATSLLARNGYAQCAAIEDDTHVEVCTEQRALTRRHSWSHLGQRFDKCQGTSLGCQAPRRLLQERSDGLEATMEWCKQELHALSTGGLQLGFTPTLQQPRGCRLRHGITAPAEFLAALAEHNSLSTCSTPSEPETSPRMRRVHRLSSELEVLAAEALQCSCDRNVPGAMDIFVQATMSLETLGSLVHDIEQADSASGNVKQKKRASTVGPLSRLLPWNKDQSCEVKGRESALLPQCLSWGSRKLP
jgi:hypothetical protein